MLNGVDYGSQGHGFLFFHSNNAITFDLNAIRKANVGWTIGRFLTTVGNGSPRDSSLVDFCVLVDGQMRYRAREFSCHSGGVSVATSITPDDRFLTLITTDGGNGITGDWTLFGDPRLELIPTNNRHSVSAIRERGEQ
jgi:hypothetical protein